jgi:hypothetical protein
MEEDIKLHITSLQFEGIIQASWDTQMETFELVVDISEFRGTTTYINSWEFFCHALRERLYHPGYLQNLLAKWLTLDQLSN